ncbi:MAG TPA: hydroxymethylbilane synthase [Myxococcota bacterium]|nr:hydroxymethylbilane synthase [Myxococcota bacterium]
MTGTLRIGTRGSPLARWQAEHVAERLRTAHPGLAVELRVVKTTGDKVLDVPLAKIGGKGLFIKEIEEALAAGEVDAAVHSMKDVPASLPPGFALAAVLERADPRDALVGLPLAALRAGVRVGTGSLRRAAQLLARVPGLAVEPLRGNVDTRLRKLDEGHYEAIVLAVAGLTRLGHAARVTEALDPDVMVPGVAQGAIGIEVRAGDEVVRAVCAPLHHAETARAVGAERALSRALGGSCEVPVAGYARREADGALVLDALVATPDGRELLRERRRGAASDPEALGRAAAEALLARGADRIMRALGGGGVRR